jgi:lysophospholipase L1-like esterase
VNRMRIGLVVLAIGLLAAFLSWFNRPPGPDDHRTVRQLILHYTLSRLDDPIIVLGDSNTEASTLPRSHCGHAIVNAGLNGASTTSDLGDWLSGALAGKRAFLIIVSLGTNDVLAAARSQQDYEANYSKLLTQLSAMAPRIVVLAIPPIDARNNVTADMRNKAMALIDSYNAALPGLAKKAGATFVALPRMADPHTVDGVHLNAAGYAVWDAAVLQAVELACNPG